jgi:raffinose/stachyose/melibiose transport system permease protein
LDRISTYILSMLHEGGNDETMSTLDSIHPSKDMAVMTKKSFTSYQSKRWRGIKKLIVALSFIGPALVLYVLFMLYPMVDAVRLSFFDWNGSSPTMNFVGLDNYKELSKDTIYIKSLVNNLYWVVLSLMMIIAPTLALSILISKVKRGRTFFRTAFFLPSVLSLTVVGVLWNKIYDPSNGPLNMILRMLGLDSLTHNWLGEGHTVIPSLVVTSSWSFYGLYMVLFLAALQNIDHSLYEAAEMDGAGPLRKFWNITVPSLRNTMNVVMSMDIIYSLKGFGVVWVMTQGGPFYMSEVVASYVYKAAFSLNKVSYAVAGSVVLGMIVIVLTISFNFIRDRRE